MRYSAQNLHIPHSLFYSWTGWPEANGSFRGPLPDEVRQALYSAWADDGFTVHSFRLETHEAKLTCSVDPTISPVFFATRAKGRLQHALRRAQLPCSFSRKAAVRALGRNITDTVIAYVRNQLVHVDLADDKYRRRLALVAQEDVSVDLTAPTELNRSRYWYNLHLVYVTADRFRMGGDQLLGGLRERFPEAATATGCRLRSLSIMPDHVHVALRANPTGSPKEIGLSLQNDVAAVAGCKLWQDEFYAGTFSEYDLNAIPKERKLCIPRSP
jgi:REP element-mobilizing transposase RayT